MYDTSGNEKWYATTAEYFGGKDVELDDLGNSYILTGNYNEVNKEYKYIAVSKRLHSSWFEPWKYWKMVYKIFIPINYLETLLNPK